MNSFFATLMVLCMFQLPGIAQKSSAAKQFNIWVKTGFKPYMHKGFLYLVKDDYLLLASHFYPCNDRRLQQFTIEDIKSIHVRRSGNIWKGVVVGALAGFGYGVLRASKGKGKFSDCDLPLVCSSKTERAFFNGTAYMLPGMLAGAIFGSIKATVKINGNVTTFKIKKQWTKKYQIQY